MLIKQLIEISDLLDDPYVDGKKITDYLHVICADANISIHTIRGEKGKTDEVKIVIPGINGRFNGGQSPTLGIIGRLGGIGARPNVTGFVSDGDGALVALTIAAKLLCMHERGENLQGDIIISTHICPSSPIQPHYPVPFMGSVADMETMNHFEVDPAMDAILVFDTTKGNNILNYSGYAITNTVKAGWILRVSDDLLQIMARTSGCLPVVLPVSMQDITPYGNGIFHINSILQPCTVTDAPVVGVAITTETCVPGCAANSSHFDDLESTANFGLETAVQYTANNIAFYDNDEYERILQKYGNMKILQTLGQS